MEQGLRMFNIIKRFVYRAIYRLIGREVEIDNSLQPNASHQVVEYFTIIRRFVDRAIYCLIGAVVDIDNRRLPNPLRRVFVYLDIIIRFFYEGIYRFLGRRVWAVAAAPGLQPEPHEYEAVKDIIGCLPPELSQSILRLLNPEDLENCLAVSMRWRLLANDNIVWKDHCLMFATLNKIQNIQNGVAPIPNLRQIQVFGKEEPDIEECCMDRKYKEKLAYAVDLLAKSKQQGLMKCKLAEAYVTMRANVLSNWLTGRFAYYSFDMGTDVKNRNEKLRTFWSKDGSLGYICSSKFHVVVQFIWSEKIVRSLPINDGMLFHDPTSVAFSNKYFAMTSGPAIRIMKRQEHGYTFYKQYKLSEGQIFACRENASFAPGGPYLFVGPLSERYIWLYTSRYIFVLSLEEPELWTPIILPNETPTIMDNGDYVCVMVSTSIMLFGINGSKLHQLEMKDQERIYEVACDRYIVYSIKNSIGAGEIWAWNPWKGIQKHLLHICDSDVRLHTNKELIYILEISRPNYRTIMAMDIELQAVLWVVPLNFPVYWCNVVMKTVCGDLLFCYLPTGRTSHVKIFNQSGREVDTEYFPKENRHIKFQDCGDTRVLFSFKSYLTIYNYND